MAKQMDNRAKFLDNFFHQPVDAMGAEGDTHFADIVFSPSFYLVQRASRYPIEIINFHLDFF